MTLRTGNAAIITTGAATITGEIWTVGAPLPNAGAGANFDAYNTRNTGKTEDIYTFFGVRYATAQRFSPPVLAGAPTGTVDATSFGNVPPQGYRYEIIDGTYGRSDLGQERGLTSWGALGTREGEDCTFLNIYTPTLVGVTAALPVIVHFHGGGSNYLSACDDRMSGHRINTKGCVVVRVEVRQSNLGHYYLPGMENEAGYNGVNFSVMDAMTALQWVQNHISIFGGNPSNVTIMGGSAGGNMCNVLLANPTARTLFQKVMSSSASAGVNRRWEAEPSGQNVGYKQYFKDRQAVFEKLFFHMRSNLTGHKLLSDVQADLITGGMTNDEAFTEIMRFHISTEDFRRFDGGHDGQQLNQNAYRATRSLTIMNDGMTVFHQSNRNAGISGDLPATHPCMFWSCAEEANIANLAGMDWGRELLDMTGLTTNAWAKNSTYGTLPWDSPETWGGALDFTQPVYPWAADTTPLRVIFNHEYQYSAYCMARGVTDAGGTSYLGVLNWLPVNNLATHVGHTADEPMWFGNIWWCLDAPQGGAPEPFTVNDIKFVESFMNMLAAFAWTGDPNDHTNAGYAKDFDLFDNDPLEFNTMVAFNPAPGQGDANVVGRAARDRNDNLREFRVLNWDTHFWDYYDTLPTT